MDVLGQSKVWWAIRHYKSRRCADGARNWIEGGASVEQPFRLFRTKTEAESYIKQHYGYIATRPDLRAYPHGDLMPAPVRVVVYLVSTKGRAQS